jgi:hypothetical protein
MARTPRRWSPLGRWRYPTPVNAIPIDTYAVVPSSTTGYR